MIMVEYASPNMGFMGIGLMVFLMTAFFLCRAWCLTDTIRKTLYQRRN